MNGIEIVSASAGSGKTHRLVEVLEHAVTQGGVRPEAVIATTFTVKAAAELRERVRLRLLENGLVSEAQRLALARIGTVNSVCGSLVTDYAFELGLSPELRVLDEEGAEEAFERTLSARADVSRDAEGEAGAGSEAAVALQELATRMPGLDWVDHVREIATHARMNRIEPQQLRESAARSRDTLLALFPSPAEDGAAIEVALRTELQRFVHHPKLDPSGKTVEVVDHCRRLLTDFDEGRRPSWLQWASVVRKSKDIAKKSADHIQPLVAAARACERHPALRDDLVQVVEQVFTLAAQALEDYQAYKREWGLLDFADQERHALTLLERPEVQERLRGQFELLLVDEFQDTSPLQLEVFLALSRIVPRSVWVGDQKQAIYGFRGTDPSLMDAAIEALERESGTPVETLTQSWRSRAPLVHLTSDVFAAAFATQGLPAERVRLEPSPQTVEDPVLGSFVEVWRIETMTQRKSEVAAAVADRIAALLADEGTHVRDRSTNEPRRATMRDIAVLCRSGVDTHRVAAAIEAVGLDAVIGEPGLMGTLEGRVALAALRLWVDSEDALALAELARIVMLPEEPQAWFERLLDRKADAFTELPEYLRVREARAAAPEAGVLLAFDRALAAVGARELCLRWGHTPQRLANLDRLRAYAVGYVTRGRDEQQTLTLPGLVVHLLGLSGDKKDHQATPGDQDAVTVSTMHGAKGLEWPITILYGLDRDYPSQAFGVHVESPVGPFSFAAPLAGRWIRFWPDPFWYEANARGKPKGGGMPLHERAAMSEQHAVVAKREARELLRVLYVAWTRARDRLVLTAKRGKLLSHQWGEVCDTQGLPLLVEPEQDGLVTWANHTFHVRVQEARAGDPLPPSREPVFGYPIRAPGDYPPARVSPSALEGEGTIGSPERLGPALSVQAGARAIALGDACHAFFAGERAQDDTRERERMASEQLEAFEVLDLLRPADLARLAESFRAWVEGRWPGARWCREWPMQRRWPDGSEMRGYSDLVLETSEGFVVLDHKCLGSGLDDALRSAAGYRAQLDAYSEALRLATGRPVLSRWIHLPFQGVVVEVTAGD